MEMVEYLSIVKKGIIRKCENKFCTGTAMGCEVTTKCWKKENIV